MTRKIVGIAGGGNGRFLKNGGRDPYELEKIDGEIVRLTGKQKPNFLLLAHSQPLQNQASYFETMKNIYAEKFGCDCKYLPSDELSDLGKVKKLVDWADIIFEGGGDTQSMIRLWKETGFDKILEMAWESGKVMCGVSAGANCWFNCCNSDSLRIQMKDNSQPMIQVDCLNFVDAMFIPHCDEGDRYESAKEQLRENGKIGLLLSNCSALEIVDDKWRILTTEPTPGFHNIKKAYAKRLYWNGGIFIENNLVCDENFRKLDELLRKK